MKKTMAKASDMITLRELITQEPEFKRIEIVANALERWNVDMSIREQVRIHGRQSGVDVLDLLHLLPAKLGYESAEQFVCGYQPLGGRTAETAEFGRWDSLCRQALTVARQPADADWSDLHKPVDDLVAGLAEFVGERYRLYQFMKEARASRTSL
ncbi:MAG: hypothetical protein M3003_14920 [Candidatus Dormibacteraeota bacterium]|nr:hypothetical protein [Candidatus Dormibacteraeota bacterium]